MTGYGTSGRGALIKIVPGIEPLEQKP